VHFFLKLTLTGASCRRRTLLSATHPDIIPIATSTYIFTPVKTAASKKPCGLSAGSSLLVSFNYD
jgi:hypothetical protein